MTRPDYEFSGQYWADELKRLELAVQYLLQYKQLNGEHPFDPMRGLMVTEEEVVRLLGHSDGVQDELPEELQRLAHIIGQWGLYIGDRLEATARAGARLPLDVLAERFALGETERLCVIVSLAVELDRKFEKLYGYLNDDVTSKSPTLGLSAQLVSVLEGGSAELPEAQVRAALAADGSLIRDLLEEAEDGGRGAHLLTRPLRLDERIVRFLLHDESADPMLDGVTHLYEPGETPPALLVGQETLQRLQRLLDTSDAPSAVGIGADKGLFVLLHGPKGSGKKLLLRHLCGDLELPLLVVEGGSLGAERRQVRSLLRRIVREATLTGAVLAIDYGAEWEQLQEESPWLLAEWRRALNGFEGLVCWLSQQTKRLTALPAVGGRVFACEAHIPSAQERERLWSHEAAARGWTHPLPWRALAELYRFTPGQIIAASAQAEEQARWEGATQIEEAHLRAGALAQMDHRLERKARRLFPRHTFEDLILPSEQKDLLRQAYYQAKFRAKVYGDWGFDRRLSYGKGLSMLFAGPPGTGKTMAAEVVAGALELEVYKIDLSQMISKYIGETEKNLHELYEEAGKSNAILFFDESDALFGKRSEVKDAHDKYANVETAYLLQKMEEYEGISILATNFQQNIDEAFMRRINLVVKFPFPDAEHREQLWRTMVPPEAPLGEDVDFGYLADKLEMAGGGIKNIVVTAAFLAAAEDQPIGMRHFVAGAKQELKKTGKILVNDQWGGYD
ncbi:ATP-binding protein [Paenibacillus sp. IB182496]|uniref:ATP-binding protein n=1 Tax=Paenibacillus sabuli TaxID=2772509 RepID=A0A927BUG0_9BACL|nr:ATP-binding protein [Paenibacillus sabuli]MBD2846096.1 ATP-binding protein [Paenibacillus sabuli]